jgi:hypothetical protein
VILAAGDAAVRAAQRATASIPILAFTDDMLGQGFVRSLGQPGGNITGVTLLASELDGKRERALRRFLAAAQFGQRDAAAVGPARRSARLERTTARGTGKDSIDHPRDQHDDLANVVAGAATLARTHGGYFEALVRACRDDDAPDEPTWADRERLRRYDELMRRYGQPVRGT